MPRKPVAFRIEEELLSRVDAEAGRLGQTRTVFVERALEKALGREDGVAMGTASPVPGPVEFEPPAPPRASKPGFARQIEQNVKAATRGPVPDVPGVVRASTLVKQGVKPIPKNQ